MDLKDIKKLIEVLENSSISKLHYKASDVELSLEKESVYQMKDEQPPVVKTPTVAEAADAKTKSGVAVLSPLVGTFYEASGPENDPFVTVGSQVKKGETLCIIEAMKMLNEIRAPADGKVISINVKNGDIVSYNQVLMEIGE